MRIMIRNLHAFSKTICVIALFIFVFAIGTETAVRAQTAHRELRYESELRAIYPKLDAALKSKDLTKLTAYYDKNYTLQSEGKKMNHDESIAQWKSFLEFLKDVTKIDTKIEKVALIDGKYIVDYSQTGNGHVQFPGSTLLPFDYTGKSTDTWIRDEKGVWKTLSTAEHMSDFKVNGESSRPPN